MPKPNSTKPSKQAKKTRNKGGRPTKLTDETVKKLEYAFSIDATVEEACNHAGISRVTFYAWIKDNEEFLNTLEGLRNGPVLQAREAIIERLKKKDVTIAQWYLTKKRPKEFGDTSTVKHEGEIRVDLVGEAKARSKKYD